MASERQVEANRRNAGRSTGPKSAEGKARSRANATKHGLAGESAEIEEGSSPEFEGRRAKWAAERPPVGEAGNWALDRAVAASLRIERCEHAVDDLVATVRQRAQLTWEEDRAVEAATIAGRLDRDPVLASRQLQATLAGVVMLIEAWLTLVEALGPGKDWSESEASKALDLLGVAADHRSVRTPIDAPEGAHPIAFRQELALDELDRLESLRDEALIPLDGMERRRAMAGDVALLSGPAKLLLRYERDAWRRYRESMKEVQSPTPISPPVVVGPPQPRERPVPPTAPSSGEERRASQAGAAPIRLEVTNRLVSMGPGDEDGRLDELEGRLEVPTSARASATERTQSGRIPVHQGSCGVSGQ